MAATIIEPEMKPEIIKKAIEYLKANDPLGERSLDDSNDVMSCRVGYQNAIRNIEKFVFDGGYDTDNYIEGHFVGEKF